jgi:hypothetical protein
MLPARSSRAVALTLAMTVFPLAAVCLAEDTGLDAEAFGETAGTEATATDDGVVRINWSRSDLAVHREDARGRIRASMGVSTWVAFSANVDHGIVDGNSP